MSKAITALIGAAFGIGAIRTRHAIAFWLMVHRRSVGLRRRGCSRRARCSPREVCHTQGVRLALGFCLMRVEL